MIVSQGAHLSIARWWREGKAAARAGNPAAAICYRQRASTLEGAQAALASPSMGSGSARLAWAWLSTSPAISRHDPQFEPQPVRMVSSARLAQPFSAASRIWWSVTPLQMQTYTVSVGCWRSGEDRDRLHRKRE